MKQTSYGKLRDKMEEVYLVEPNDLGFAKGTLLYRKVNVYFKRMPFLFIIPLAFIVSILLSVFFGKFIVRLTTLLQYGF